MNEETLRGEQAIAKRLVSGSQGLIRLSLCEHRAYEEPPARMSPRELEAGTEVAAADEGEAERGMLAAEERCRLEQDGVVLHLAEPSDGALDQSANR